jgi:hypothetical protein
MAYGSPDWLAQRWGIKTTMGYNQSRYLYTAAGDIAAGQSGYIEITAPAGYNIIISTINVCSPVSCIDYAYIQLDDGTGSFTTYYHFYFDINGFQPFPGEATWIIFAGYSMRLYVTNNDVSTRTIRLNLAGVIEET